MEAISVSPRSLTIWSGVDNQHYQSTFCLCRSLTLNLSNMLSDSWFAVLNEVLLIKCFINKVRTARLIISQPSVLSLEQVRFGHLAMPIGTAEKHKTFITFQGELSYIHIQTVVCDTVHYTSKGSSSWLQWALTAGQCITFLCHYS